jgi:thiol-disulfide isomerase/thioredoxin
MGGGFGDRRRVVQSVSTGTMPRSACFNRPDAEAGLMNRKWMVTALALAGVLIMAGTGVQAVSPNPVVSISAEELQALMEGNGEGRHLLVAVASWCSPCRKELPALNRLFEKYRNRGLSVAAVSLDAGGPEDMQPVVDELKLTFPVYWSGPDAAKKYNIIGVPTLFLIKGGKTVEKLIGQRSEKFLEEKIQKLLED